MVRFTVQPCSVDIEVRVNCMEAHAANTHQGLRVINTQDDTHGLVIAKRHPRPHSVHHWLYPTGRAHQHRGPTATTSREAYPLNHLNRLDALPRRTSASPGGSHQGPDELIRTLKRDPAARSHNTKWPRVPTLSCQQFSRRITTSDFQGDPRRLRSPAVLRRCRKGNGRAGGGQGGVA